MFHRKLKVGYFALEALNAFGATYYFNYLFFFMRDKYGFENRENLTLAALHGFIYMLSAWYGGSYSQKKGYYSALRLGFSIMGLAMLAACFARTMSMHVIIMSVWTFGMCFTWPTLEALTSEQETRRGLQQMLGIYNLVWAGFGALAYFMGGVLQEYIGPKSLFIIPGLMHGAQLVLVYWLSRQVHLQDAPAPAPEESAGEPEYQHVHLKFSPKTFLRMAYICNPFAYVAINTVVAVIPALASQLGLSPVAAGIFCSIWLFARLLAFYGLWKWHGWHYHFEWLLGSYVALIISFGVLLLIPKLWVVVVAQIIFGLVIGLIYYSSLFYSMDVGETKGEHGGFHEAAIGSGIFVGPAMGAASLHFFPQKATSSTLGVACLLILGLAGIMAMRFWKSQPRPGASENSGCQSP